MFRQKDSNNLELKFFDLIWIFYTYVKQLCKLRITKLGKNTICKRLKTRKLDKDKEKNCSKRSYQVRKKTRTGYSNIMITKVDTKVPVNKLRSYWSVSWRKMTRVIKQLSTLTLGQYRLFCSIPKTVWRPLLFTQEKMTGTWTFLSWNLDNIKSTVVLPFWLGFYLGIVSFIVTYPFFI